jgi:hypothetical protein
MVTAPAAASPVFRKLRRFRRVLDHTFVIFHFVPLPSCVHAFLATKTKLAARTILCFERIMT